MGTAMHPPPKADQEGITQVVAQLIPLEGHVIVSIEQQIREKHGPHRGQPCHPRREIKTGAKGQSIGGTEIHRHQTRPARESKDQKHETDQPVMLLAFLQTEEKFRSMIVHDKYGGTISRQKT